MGLGERCYFWDEYPWPNRSISLQAPRLNKENLWNSFVHSLYHSKTDLLNKGKWKITSMSYTKLVLIRSKKGNKTLLALSQHD